MIPNLKAMKVCVCVLKIQLRQKKMKSNRNETICPAQNHPFRGKITLPLSFALGVLVI